MYLPDLGGDVERTFSTGMVGFPVLEILVVLCPTLDSGPKMMRLHVSRVGKL